MRLFLAWVLAMLAVVGTPALAALPPRPAGPVLDQAGIIPDAQEAALDAKLRAYNAATGRAVIVATVSSLDDLPVEDYAQQLSESWDIGGAKSEQGVLLLIAPTERKLRIHAARGVQERLPDVLAGRIIRDTMAPRLRAGDMAGGIAAGVEAITQQLDRDPADAKAIAEAAATAEAQGASGKDGVNVGSVIFWVFLILFFMLMFGRRGRRGIGRSGIDPGIVLWGLSEVLHHANRGGGSSWGGGSSGGGGFGGFGGGGGGFDGGGASGDW